jgi:hypothetical protein
MVWRRAQSVRRNEDTLIGLKTLAGGFGGLRVAFAALTAAINPYLAILLLIVAVISGIIWLIEHKTGKTQ